MLGDAGHDVDDLPDEDAPARPARRDRRPGDEQELAAEALELRLAPERPGKIEDRRGRHVPVLRSERRPADPEALRDSGALDLGHQARLPDPGFTGDQEELTAAGRDLVQASRREAEDVVASDEER